ncbi:unnamed protein product [Closterium sp. NIES-54]
MALTWTWTALIPGGGGRGSGGAGRGGTQRSGSGGGQRQQQQRSPETPSPQQLSEWYAGRQRGGGAGPCTYVLRTGDRTGEQCGGPHSTQRCFGRLTDAWHHQFPDATEIPRWGDLSRAGVAVFDLDYDAILAAMYALSTSDEGDCYLYVPPDPGIEAAALGAGETAALGASASVAPGAGESAPSGTASAQVFHTFTLDSGASRSFFRDRTTLTPLSRPVAVLDRVVRVVVDLVVGVTDPVRHELRWLTYLLTDLGEQPRSPPVLYVDNKAMLALCREHRLEHRTKHIALRYFLSRELQQRGQLRLAYVASEVNTADIFTKALAPGDHQRFCTLLGLVPTWPHLLTS